jgi:hypothetical protein
MKLIYTIILLLLASPLFSQLNQGSTNKGVLIYYGDNFYFLEGHCIMNKNDLSSLSLDTCFQFKELDFDQVGSNSKSFQRVLLDEDSSITVAKWKYIYFSNVFIDLKNSKYVANRNIEHTDFLFLGKLYQIYFKDMILQPNIMSFNKGRLGEAAQEEFIEEIKITPPNTFRR